MRLAVAITLALGSVSVSSAPALSRDPDASSPAEPSFEPGSGGTFRYAASLGVPMWDPAGLAINYGPTYYDVVYDALLLERSDGSLVPGLATEWEVSDESVVFTLRQGVTFQDGTPFDAESVVYNIQRVKEQPNANANLLAVVERVEVISDHEVALHLTERAPNLLSVLARMPGMMVSPNVSPDEVATGAPAGTGPYRIVEFTEDVTVLERNPEYWDPTQQYVDRIEFRVLNDPDARLNALLTGQVDAAELPAAQASSAEDAGFSLNHTRAIVSTVNVIDVGGESVPELADSRVRQAIAHSIDRDAWGTAVERGIGEPTFQLFPEGSPWHLDDWDGYGYDPERARQLLAEAGVEPGDIHLELFGFGAFIPRVQVLQQMFGEIGIEVSIVQVAPGGLVKPTEEGRIAVAVILPAVTHPETLWGEYFDGDVPRNAWGQVAPGAAEAREGVAAASVDNLDAAYQEMLRVIYEEAWGIPLWVGMTNLAFDAELFPNVHGRENVVLGVAIREMAPT